MNRYINWKIRHRSKDGFTLVEIMFALFVFVVAILSVVWVAANSLQESRKTHMNTVATSLAQQKLEELRNSDYFELTSGRDEDDDGIRIVLDEYGQSGGDFYRNWTVVEDDPMVGTKTITVYVTWEEAEERTISVATIVARPFPEGMM